MYLAAFRLREDPFGVTPDPRFLYLSESHRSALRALQSGIDRGRGFLALVAEPGMGKTTLAYQLLNNLSESTRSLFLFQTQCDSRELFRYLLSGVGVEARDGDIVAMHEKLNEILARESLAGRRFILLIDEAQNLSDSVLETVRLLSDFETPTAKLIQIVLVGQPQLAKKLSNPDLSQLRQRLGVVAQLGPLSSSETLLYIHHRLQVAGYEGGALFTVSAIERIAELSRGIPRVINNICSNALDIGYAIGRPKIDSAVVEEAAALLDLDLSPKKTSSPLREGSAPALKSAGTPMPHVGAEPKLILDAPAAPPVPWEGTPQPALRESFSQLQPASRESVAPRPVIVPPPQPQPRESPPAPQPVAHELVPKPLQPSPTEKTASQPAAVASAPNRQVSIPKPVTPKPASVPLVAQLPRQFAPHFMVVRTERRTVGALVGIGVLLAGLALVGWFTFYPFEGSEEANGGNPAPVSAPASVGTTSSQIANPASAPGEIAPAIPADSGVSASSTASETRPVNAVTVVVKPHQTLQQICMQYVGRYDQALLREILELNPRIASIDHIEVGQEIWIPIGSRPPNTSNPPSGVLAGPKPASAPNP